MTNAPQKVLMRPLTLFLDIDVSKKDVLLCGWLFGPLQMVLM